MNVNLSIQHFRAKFCAVCTCACVCMGRGMHANVWKRATIYLFFLTWAYASSPTGMRVQNKHLSSDDVESLHSCISLWLRQSERFPYLNVFFFRFRLGGCTPILIAFRKQDYSASILHAGYGGPSTIEPCRDYKFHLTFRCKSSSLAAWNEKTHMNHEELSIATCLETRRTFTLL